MLAQFRSSSKINLYLNILSQDPSDGYHFLESIFYEIPWGDDFEIYESKEDKIIFEGDNIPKQNTVSKALALFKESFSVDESFLITIKKNVPSGAGLGGGSGDAGALLKWLCERYEISVDDCIELAQKVGSDVPFFLYGGVALVEGKGEKITPLTNKLENMDILVVFPEIHVSTKLAFEAIKSSINKPSLVLNKNIFKKQAWDIDNMREIVYNIFNNELKAIDEQLVKIETYLKTTLSPDIMCMSGSGSSFVLFYSNSENCPEISSIEGKLSGLKYFIQSI